MSDVNLVVIVGRLGGDPEYKVFEDGNGVANFSVATNRPTKAKETDWHRVSAFRKAGEFVRDYLKKGDLVCVRGSIQYRKTGEGKGYTDIIAYNVDGLGSKAENEQPKGDDLPF